MKSKTKNNIIIIVFVTLAAVSVIVAVLVTGFANNGSESGSLPSSESTGLFVSEEQPNDSESETQSDDLSQSSYNSESNGGGEDGIGQKIVASASALIGVPFVMNGYSPEGFDNSGFIYYVLRDNGFITCPRTTESQAQMGTYVDRNGLKPGDLVFFSNEIGEKAGFGGIYIGNGKMIAALMPDTNVNVIDITTEYYVSHFFGGVSLG